MAVNVGENLRRLIEAARSNPSQVAHAIGRDPATVLRWCDRPDPRISVTDLDKIAAFLQIAPHELRERLKAQEGEIGMLSEGVVGFGVERLREDLAVERLDSYARRLRDLESEYRGRIQEITRLAQEEIDQAKAAIREKPKSQPAKGSKRKR